MTSLEPFRSGFYELYAQCFPQLVAQQSPSAAAEQVFNSVRSEEALAAIVLTLKNAIRGSLDDAAAQARRDSGEAGPSSSNGSGERRNGTCQDIVP